MGESLDAFERQLAAAKAERMKLVQPVLRQIVFSEYGVPDRKMPNCPCCDEDELFGRPWGSASNRFACYRCNWRFECASPEVQP